MYENHFGLKERPYSISPDPRFIYLTGQHQEALAKCQYAIDEKMGLSVIYGDIGTGKTSLARRLLQLCSDNERYRVALLVHPNYPSPFQFIKEIRREFGFVKPRRSLTDELNDFRAFLVEQFQQSRTPVLLIDEAQRLRPPLFEVIRQLLNFETNTQKLLQVVLFGQTELPLKIDRLHELKDRVSIFGALSPMSRQDTEYMIAYRWRVAGGSEHAFTSDAIDAIFRYSGGRPRLVCKICENALILAASREMSTIDGIFIQQAAQEIRVSSPPEAKQPAEKRERVGAR